MASTKFGDLYKQAKADGSFDDVIEQGDFTLEVVRANSSPTQKGDEQIGILFEVKGGPENTDLPDDDAAKGTKGWVNLNFSEKAAPISLKFLRNIGVPDEVLDEAESGKDIAEILPGTVVDATVTHRTWGKDDENTAMNLAIHNVLVPPAVAGVVDPTPAKPKAKAKAAPADEEPF